jgi:hypothetical protein
MNSFKFTVIGILLFFLASACSTKTPELANQPTKIGASVSLPAQVGACIESKIAGKFFRLWALDDPELPKEEYAVGKEIVLKLPGGMFLYTEHIGDRFLDSDNYAVGNPVQLCLVSLPTDCPPGDDRGKEYSLLDRRTGFSGIYIDSWHLCGGA